MLQVDTIPNNLCELVYTTQTKDTDHSDSTSASKAPKFVMLSFEALLEQAKLDTSPFHALCRMCNQVKENVWSTEFTHANGAKLDCVLTLSDEWDSTSFGTAQKGPFHYVELFQGNNRLAYIRMSQDHVDGEWIEINKGDSITGQQAKELAEKVSRAMRLQICYLADAAKVPMTIGGELSIRVPLQIMRGTGYYGPTFQLLKTLSTKSNVLIAGTTRTLYYKQNPKKHAEKLSWLQNLKITQIKDAILCPDAKKWLTATKKRHFAQQNEITLQQFIKGLYDKKEAAREDYEWACVHLLTFSQIPRTTKIQKQYYDATKSLLNDMLMFATFSPG
ncbi:MAG: hypothetical protein JSR37_03040 [Verrucomicrobia bacterium]|nr:hypothetical protein [Verrucomicrobiota bacterium]MBS0637059.1 hypothetical protein [Verrucomicrobiota bacterium]